MTRLSSTRANPAVLAWARRNSGRDIDTIAKRLEIAPAAYAETEAGARRLTLSQLRTFADLVKRPIATLYLPSVPPDVKRPQDYRSSTGSVGREAMLSFRKALQVQELSTTPFAETSQLFAISATLSASPAVLAAEARAAVGLTPEQQTKFRNGAEFTRWLVDVLASLGVHVLFHTYAVGDSKAYTLSGVPPVIVINRRDFLNSQLFSLVHELCHLLLRKPGMCDTIGAGGGSILETFCNRFASNFIIPNDWITKVIEEFARDSLSSDDTLSGLAQIFSTSRDVVLLKLVDLGAVDASAYSEYRNRWEAEQTAIRNKRKGGRTSVKVRTLNDNGSLFVSEVIDAYVSNHIGVVDAGELLGINPGYIEDVVGVGGGPG